MLYKQNSAPSLSDGLFKNPTSEFRGTPFWAWNSLLTKEELERQIDVFNEMGLGGFHMHVRTGLKNKYLSDEYIDRVRDCINKAKDNKMLAWLYDEDRWPSGAAGGIVTKDDKYRARNLLFTTKLSDEIFISDDSSARGGRSGNGSLIAVFDIVLDENDCLKSAKRINADDAAEGVKWYALLEIHGSSSWYNDQAYADTLNKEAIERFVEVTHQRYADTIGDEFDRTVPAIFTDEPQFTRKRTLKNSADKDDAILPWTDKVPELFKKQYGYDIVDFIPELFWELPDGRISVARYHYHDFIAELFAESFADTVGSWCGEHGISLTGHMMEEPTLHSQTAALGEAMRSYRSFGIPGIDLLCNRREFTTAKQTQSAVHQYGKEGMLSELYGVTGWDADFRLYKFSGDWQAALGVTVRVPHLSWYAMGGEAKRDYPASISYQSPWFKKYHLVEDHFARVNTALTRGKSVVKVGVIHPVESFWLHWGPEDKTNLLRNTLDSRFQDLTDWLLEGSIDFDFIAESLLPDLCEKGSNPLKVGQMEYDAIVVPGCETLRSTTVERLGDFLKAGGKLLFLGSAPRLMDAKPDSAPGELYEKAEKADYSRGAVLTALDPIRTVTIRNANGSLSDRFMYQLRQDTDCRWLFIAHSKEPGNKDIANGDTLNITVKGEYIPVLYDTFDGSIKNIGAKYRNGNTVIPRRVYDYDSLLIKLIPGKTDAEPVIEEAPYEFPAVVTKTSGFELSEDNVLLLDLAEYKLGDEEDFNPEEEILRLDNICRFKKGLRGKSGGIVQPWVYGDTPNPDRLTLRYKFESEISYKGAILAIEEAQTAEITFNGEKVDTAVIGNYVDIDIDKVRLPEIVRGENTLVVTLPFGPSSNAEAMMILGRFGVRVEGRKAVITAMPENVPFGDLTKLGFPFYGGNITYKFTADAKDGKITVCPTVYRGAMISVSVDGEHKADIIYSPYVAVIDGLEDGEHEVELKLYIHRYNTFGPLHLVNESESWHGPGAWRSDGRNWSYEYVLRRTGILSAPGIG